MTFLNLQRNRESSGNENINDNTLQKLNSSLIIIYSLKNSKRKSRNKKKQVTDLCYHELPEEIFNSTTLDLQTWSLVIQDSCLKRLADFIGFKQTEKGSNQDISMIFKGRLDSL